MATEFFLNAKQCSIDFYFQDVRDWLYDPDMKKRYYEIDEIYTFKTVIKNALRPKLNLELVEEGEDSQPYGFLLRPIDKYQKRIKKIDVNDCVYVLNKENDFYSRISRKINSIEGEIT